ncbi:LuxR C-terminal-related transcriptional regulator [Streptomyces sp. NPDC051569]|uniref:response regulator transcription factor n=1 Tax=Streptomyces sp. NPDC051569 TaxID=3365661 RepID=UPI0037B38E1F
MRRPYVRGRDLSTHDPGGPLSGTGPVPDSEPAAGRYGLGRAPCTVTPLVEQLDAREFLADGAGGIGYFLKESVFDADQFIDALERVAGGGTAMDPAVIAGLLSSGPSNRRLGRLTEREHSVLGLMAEGLSNQAIGRRLFLSDSAISKYTTSLFGKLGITDDDNSNRRVLAVLAYLNNP